MGKSIKNLIYNALYNSGSWVINIVIGILITPYIVNRLNSEGFGIYTLILSIVGYYGLLDLALGQGIVKFIANYNSVDDKEGINQSINSALIVQMIVGGIASFLLIVYVDNVIEFLKVSNTFYQDTKFCIYVSAVAFFITMISGTFSSALMGLQKYGYIAKINVLSNIVISILTVVLLLSGLGLKEIIVLNGISAVILTIFYLAEVKKQIPYWRYRIFVKKIYIGRLFSFSGYYFISKILNFIGNYLIRFIISFLLGPACVTLYIVPSKLTNAIGGFLGNAVGVIFPFSSELHSLNNKSEIQKIYISGSKFIALIAVPLFLFICVFSRPILAVWMGSEFAEKTWKVLSLVSLNSLIGSLTVVPNTIIMGLGKTKIQSVFSVATMIFFFALVPVFTKWWGLEGTIGALLISTIPGIVLVLYTTSKIIELKIVKYINEVLRPHYLMILISTILYVLSLLVNQNTLKLNYIIAYISIYSLLNVVLYWKPYLRLGKKILLLKNS